MSWLVQIIFLIKSIIKKWIFIVPAVEQTWCDVGTMRWRKRIYIHFSWRFKQNCMAKQQYIFSKKIFSRKVFIIKDKRTQKRREEKNSAKRVQLRKTTKRSENNNKTYFPVFVVTHFNRKLLNPFAKTKVFFFVYFALSSLLTVCILVTEPQLFLWSLICTFKIWFGRILKYNFLCCKQQNVLDKQPPQQTFNISVEEGSTFRVFDSCEKLLVFCARC